MEDNALRKFDEIKIMVLQENQRQLAKWGFQNHEPSEWLMFLTEEHGELANAIAEWQFRDGHETNVINEAIQTATLALKIAEMFTIAKNKRFMETYYKPAEVNDGKL